MQGRRHGFHGGFAQGPALWVLSAGLAVLLWGQGEARAQDTLTNPLPGVLHLHRRTSNQNLHVMAVDLCHAGVSVRATGPGEGPRTVPSFGQMVGAQIAINGDFYGNGSTDGPAIHNGQQWSGNNHSYVGPVVFGQGFAAIVPHWNTDAIPGWIQEAVSGHPTILWEGVVQPDGGDPLCYNRHPRTAVGFSADERWMYFAVVDGRRSAMIGMTCPELAELMKEFGAFKAQNMDGGGSATMWMAGAGVLNNPSDGQPRSVLNHLAVMTPGAGRPAHCTAWRAGLAGHSENLGPERRIVAPAGSEFDVWLEFTNEGQLEWAPGVVNLGTTQPRDRPSALAAPDWLGPNRPATVHAAVARGQLGRFAFRLKVPEVPGEYVETFNLVAEMQSWFSDSYGPGDEVITLRVVALEPSAGPPDAGPGTPVSGDDAALAGGGAAGPGPQERTDGGVDGRTPDSAAATSDAGPQGGTRPPAARQVSMHGASGCALYPPSQGARWQSLVIWLLLGALGVCARRPRHRRPT